MREGIIDAHVHFIPRVAGIVPGGKVVNLGHGQVLLPGGKKAQILPLLCTKTNFEIETILRLMDSHGVKRCILMQGPVYGEFSDAVAQEAKNRPDRFIPTMSVDPVSPRAAKRITDMVEGKGVRILKLECSESTGLMGMHPGLQFDGPEMRTVWDVADAAGMTVVIDPGPIDGPGYQVDPLRRVIKEHRQTHFVIAHLGFADPLCLTNRDHRNRWWSMIRLAENANAWIEISAMPYFYVSEEYPYPSAIRLMAEARDQVGAQKLVWGSDAPCTLQYATYRQMIEFIDRSSELSEKEKQQIFSENAGKAFSL